MSNEQEKPTASSLSDNFNSFIPEFYIDIVCRIIPGGVAIFLWFPALIFQKSPAAKIDDVFRYTCVFLAAWVIGTTSEKLIYTLGIGVVTVLKYLWRKCGNRWTAKAGWVLCTLDFFDGIKCSQKPLMQYEIYERRLLLRNMAEVILFRMMAVISALTALLRPVSYPSGYNNVTWGFSMTVAFLICWYWGRHNYLRYGLGRNDT